MDFTPIATRCLISVLAAQLISDLILSPISQDASESLNHAFFSPASIPCSQRVCRWGTFYTAQVGTLEASPLPIANSLGFDEKRFISVKFSLPFGCILNCHAYSDASVYFGISQICSFYISFYDALTPEDFNSTLSILMPEDSEI